MHRKSETETKGREGGGREARKKGGIEATQSNGLKRMARKRI